MQLLFIHPDPMRSVLVSAPYIKITGGQILMGPAETVIAQYRDPYWECGQDRFVSLRCRGIRLELRGETSAKAVGHFDEIVISAGIACDHGRVLARLDAEEKSWRCDPDSSEWSTLLITPMAN